MNLHGANFLASSLSSEGNHLFRAVNPATGQELDPAYHEATPGELDQAMESAAEAYRSNRRHSPEERARLLETIAVEIEALGNDLVERVCSETALPEARVKGERQRTIGQLRMFAALVREGSWVEARIDRAEPGRQPIPKPDIRRMHIPIGPVVVFGAGNFPLAFSVAGGDTASALAAGCPVVVKAHPAHPGTSELTAQAVQKAIAESGFHPGAFSLLHAQNPDISIRLVRHPVTAAVGFTGSFKAGRALFDAAASRPKPIPVYAEMGSVNPVFILPGALRDRLEAISEGLAQSVTLGVGQFCTNPGLVIGIHSEELTRFVQQLTGRINEAPAGNMLHRGICTAYREGLEELRRVGGVTVAAAVATEAGTAGTQAGAAVLITEAETFLSSPRLAEEVFGPSTLLIRASSAADLESIVEALEGNLTATVHGTEEDLLEYRRLVGILEEKVGRIVFNGFPTGVEVCPSMHHGGPYPATTDSKFTSVGTAAIYRFTRPVCYQNAPQALLPEELHDSNPRGIWRLLDGRLTRQALQEGA
jgi:2,5-dioxopentanoate dehydrogenase